MSYHETVQIRHFFQFDEINYLSFNISTINADLNEIKEQRDHVNEINNKTSILL